MKRIFFVSIILLCSLLSSAQVPTKTWVLDRLKDLEKSLTNNWNDDIHDSLSNIVIPTGSADTFYLNYDCYAGLSRWVFSGDTIYIDTCFTGYWDLVNGHLQPITGIDTAASLNFRSNVISSYTFDYSYSDTITYTLSTGLYDTIAKNDGLGGDFYVILEGDVTWSILDTGFSVTSWGYCYDDGEYNYSSMTGGGTITSIVYNVILDKTIILFNPVLTTLCADGQTIPGDSYAKYDSVIFNSPAIYVEIPVIIDDTLLVTDNSEFNGSITSHSDVILNGISDGSPDRILGLDENNLTVSVDIDSFDSSLFYIDVDSIKPKDEKILNLPREIYSNGIEVLYTYSNIDRIKQREYLYNENDLPLFKITTQYNTGSQENPTWIADNGTLFGLYAGTNNRGSNLTAFGYEAGYNNSSSELTAFGIRAGKSTSYLTWGVCIGYEAGLNWSGSYNTFVGYRAGTKAIYGLGGYSTFIGSYSGYNSSSNWSTFIGHWSGYYNLGDGNVGVGDHSLSNSSEDYTTAVGYYAGYQSQSPRQIAIGYSSGNTASGDYMISIGTRAGQSGGGARQILIGDSTGIGSRGNYTVLIGNKAGVYNQGHNTITLGNMTGSFNNSDSIIQIGYQSENFRNDTSTTVTFETNDFKKGINGVFRIYVPGHGFDAAGQFVNLRFNVISGASVTGLVDNTVYTLQVDDVDSIIVSYNVDTTGTGVYSFTKNYDINNSITIGTDVYATKEGQTIIGNDNTTETIIRGDLLFPDTHWGDLITTAESAKPGVNSKPTYNYDSLALEWDDADSTTNYIVANFQLHHSYAPGTDIYPHVHYIQSSASDTVEWFILLYKWTNIGGQRDADFTRVHTINQTVLPYSAGSIHQIAEFDAIDGTGKSESSILECKLYCWSNGEILTKEFDIHFEMNKPGTYNEYP